MKQLLEVITYVSIEGLKHHPQIQGEAYNIWTEELRSIQQTVEEKTINKII